MKSLCGIETISYMKFVSIPYNDFIYEIFIYEMLCEIDQQLKLLQLRKYHVLGDTRITKKRNASVSKNTMCFETPEPLKKIF
jgi:hypothetical protein